MIGGIGHGGLNCSSEAIDDYKRSLREAEAKARELSDAELEQAGGDVSGYEGEIRGEMEAMVRAMQRIGNVPQQRLLMWACTMELRRLQQQVSCKHACSRGTASFS